MSLTEDCFPSNYSNRLANSHYVIFKLLTNFSKRRNSNQILFLFYFLLYIAYFKSALLTQTNLYNIQRSYKPDVCRKCILHKPGKHPQIWENPRCLDILSQSIPVTSLVRSNDFFFTTDNGTRAALANTFLDIISSHKHQQRRVLNPYGQSCALLLILVALGLHCFAWSWLQCVGSSSPIKDQTWGPALGAWSLTHWTTRWVPFHELWSTLQWPFPPTFLIFN